MAVSAGKGGFLEIYRKSDRKKPTPVGVGFGFVWG
jgi:hypothetical protein